MADFDPREMLKRDLKKHPRVEFQGLFQDEALLDKVVSALPGFVPFKGPGYTGAAWILDWDHKLPSRDLMLRLFVFYSEEARAAFGRGFEARRSQIASEEIFPEFDVSDFAGLPADEAYETELTPVGEPKKFKLVSEWRREVDPRLGRRAEDIARRSAAYKELSSQVRTRAAGLGDLEAAEWAAPCESGHKRWGVDVWYLRSFNGMVGEGTAFLVDLEDEVVIGQHEFQFRAG